MVFLFQFFKFYHFERKHWNMEWITVMTELLSKKIFRLFTEAKSFNLYSADNLLNWSNQGAPEVAARYNSTR